MEIDIRHIAGLAGIELSEQELAEMLQDLQIVLQSVSNLLEADTLGVSPTFSMGDATGILLDEAPVRPGLRREDLAAIAPEMDGVYVSAPREGVRRDAQGEEPATGGG